MAAALKFTEMQSQAGLGWAGLGMLTVTWEREASRPHP